MNELKMTSDDDASKSIVLSFAGTWEKVLTTNQVKCVFRKRAPSRFTPDWIYVYAASPRSAIIGRCAVEKLERISTPKAFAMVEDGALPESKLRDYAFGYEQLYVYHIKRMKLFAEPLLWATLNANFGFSAPQSFFVLSENGKKKLDVLARLSKKSKKDIVR